MSIQNTNRIRKTLKVVPRDGRGFTPIERSFYDFLVSCAGVFPVREVAPDHLDHMLDMLDAADDGDILFASAVRWSTADLSKYYIADFALVTQGLLRPSICLVECDGHDFHERTRSQSLRDKQKDRRADAIGCKTIRFTGQELMRENMAFIAQDALASVQMDRHDRFWDVTEALGHTSSLMNLHAMIEKSSDDVAFVSRWLWQRIVLKQGNWVVRVSRSALSNVCRVPAIVEEDDFRRMFAYRGVDEHGRLVFRLRLEYGQ